jgi:dynein heavy chain
MTMSFILAIAWSFGASCYDKDQTKIDNLIKKKFQSVFFPSDTVYNLMIDKVDVKFKTWGDVLENYTFDGDLPYIDIIVPTVDSIKTSHIIEWLLYKKNNVFLSGRSGVGKSVVMEDMMRKASDVRGFETMKFIFSAKTDSKTTQTTILDGLFFLSAKCRGAKAEMTNVILVDDINMPAKEVYDAQPPIELLRQFVDNGYFYDRKDMFQVEIIDTVLLAIAAPPEGGRSVLTRRFTRHFNVICFPDPNHPVLTRIFHSILEYFLTPFQEPVKILVNDIVQASIEIYETIKREKMPIPSKFHYTFNLRDVSKVFIGLTQCDRKFVREPEHIVRLWTHETMRVYHDRLISADDRDWFYEEMIRLVNCHFRIRWEKNEIFKDNLIHYTDLMTIQEEERFYEDQPELNKILKTLEDFQDDYNEGNSSKLG